VTCIDELELSRNGVRAGAIITSTITTVLSITYLVCMIRNKKRGQGYCMGAALHAAVLLVLYGVMINSISTKTYPLSTDGLKFLFSSSFYLAFILSGVHTTWFFVFLHISSNEDGVGVCFTEP
jgi:hypothetical protein